MRVEVTPTGRRSCYPCAKTVRAEGTQNPIVIKNLDVSNALENTPQRAAQSPKKFRQNALIVGKITL
jgi:hypothetical protein